MDKLAYHLNKKKEPAKTEGKFLYYYPCDKEDNPDIWFGQKPYIVIEVSETEWEALRELDRLEYNNIHSYQRKTERIANVNEYELTPNQQERRIDRNIPFDEIINDEYDGKILLSHLSRRDRKVLEAMADGGKQSEAAKELGVTQGYISTALKRAYRSVDDYIFKAGTRTEIVWYCWNRFISMGEMPYFLDVQLEFVISHLLGDLLPFTHWFYSVGDLGRHILTYYYFDNETMDDEVAEYLQSASEEERKHYEDRYGDIPVIIGAVYIRLCREMSRRQRFGFHDSYKLYENIFDTLEKITKRLKTGVEEFLINRFYPYVAVWRNRRLRQCYKYYTGKSLPKRQ